MYFGDTFGTKPNSGVLRKKERKKNEKKTKSERSIHTPVKTVLLIFCQFSSVPCRTECI